MIPPCGEATGLGVGLRDPPRVGSRGECQEPGSRALRPSLPSPKADRWRGQGGAGAASSCWAQGSAALILCLQLTREFFTKELTKHYQGNNDTDVFSATWNSVMITVSDVAPEPVLRAVRAMTPSIAKVWPPESPLLMHLWADFNSRPGHWPPSLGIASTRRSWQPLPGKRSKLGMKPV